jgi:hypothetical protein
MNIRDIFSKPVDRPIEGVIKADDEAHLANEVEEYIVTNEVEKHIGGFFEAYNEGSNASGAWISGFFGSGKSHLLKILSLVLENRTVERRAVGDVFCEKLKDNTLLQAEVRKAIRIPSKSILFNIDQKSDIISKQEFDAILSVFLKVFNEMQGFYPKQPYIAQFERDLENSGKFDLFKDTFQSIAGESWEEGRETAHGLDADVFAKAYSAVTGNTENEGLKVLDRYYETYKVSIEDFAKMVNDYIACQEPGFRLNFFVDEVGQFIADNSKLMVNLQTIAESLSTRCQGRAWILVTSQEDMSTVVGDMARIHVSTDFSKIQDRFRTRLPLTSKDVSEVIEKRLLAKKEDSNTQVALKNLYEAEKSNFRTLFEFADGSRTYRSYKSEDSFIRSYPFIPYQYDLFQAAISGLSRNNAFTGRHASVGERSMLGVFQEVAKKIASKPFGNLASFDLMFEGIRSVIKTEHQQAILDSERNITSTLAIGILKTLFLVKYLKEFKGTARNISILMIDSFDIDLESHGKAVQEALNLLEQNTYIQRTGDIYEFLTDDEKDIENEIKATEVDDTSLAELAGNLVFDEIIRDTKIRHETNHQDYLFSRKFDGYLKGREQELGINIISPFNDRYDDQSALISQSMGQPEVLFIFSQDSRLLSDLNIYVKTDKYIRQNHNSALVDSRRRILVEKGQQNINRKDDLKKRLEKLIIEARVIVNGSELDGLGSEPKGKVINAFQQLIKFAYPNLRMLKDVIYREDSIHKILSEQGDDLFRHDENTLSEAESELLTHIRRKQTNGERPTVGNLISSFSLRPYGWYQAAIVANIGKLFMRGKVELRSDSNILDKGGVLTHLTNNRLFNNTIVFLQETFDAASVQKLKQFHREFFDENNPGSEAKEVALHFQESIRKLIGVLGELVTRDRSFPFVEKLKKPLNVLKEWESKNYAVYLKELSSFEDEWHGLKDDLIDPIRKFIHGQQGKIYLDLQHFFNDHRANLTDIAPSDAARLNEFLRSESPYRGSSLQQAKALKDSMESEVVECLETERKTVIGTIQRMVANIETFDGFEALNEQEKKRLFINSENTIEEIKHANILAVIRDKLSRYSNEGYQNQIQILNELNDAKNKAKGVEEPTRKYIPSNAVEIQYPKRSIESETDLNEYLDAIRTAYLGELKQNRKITL